MKLPSITFSQDALGRFGEVIDKEWLITNGLGGYGSSTVPAITTRKYHGLLVAALHPPGDRTVCLAKLDEDIIWKGSIYRLGTNDFQHAIYPEGYKLLNEFSLAPFPTYTYNLGGIQLAKTLFLPKNKNVVCAIYNIANNNVSEAAIIVYPLLTCRYYHTVVNRGKIPLEFTQKSNMKGFEVAFVRPQATVVSHATEGLYHENVNWIEGLHYRDETARGEADFDDCFQPGYFQVKVDANSQKTFAVTTAVSPETEAAKSLLDSYGSTSQVQTALQDELNQRSILLDEFYHLHPQVPVTDWLNWILLAADQFIVQDAAEKKSIIAGYHWFEPWGRDTFISLPGLLLTTGRYSAAKSILQHFIQYIKEGIIPNFVADRTGQPVYNTVDGTFWYVNAVLQYLKYTGDWGFVKDDLWEKLRSIVESHKKGTLYGIRVDDDGLLMHGPRLTWMDAVVEGEGITPRQGKAVEIQALWYNTLKTMELLAKKFGEPALAGDYATMAAQTKNSFNTKFWNPQQNCLFDVLDAKGADASLRPNQIFAVSLDFTMLNQDRAAAVVEKVGKEHVTPYGLRTLSLEDPKFVGKCFGNRRSRDTAYHNGTIWPWLLGPYVTATLKVNNYSPQARSYTFENMILPLFSVGIHQGGLGTINEIYDCDTPNAPRGCIAQAWSVGEPLRAYIEDILQIKPPHIKEVLG